MGEAHNPQAEIARLENVKVVEKEQLRAEVARLASEGMRFITTTCIDNEEQFEIYYHFDRDLQMTHLLVYQGKEETLPSITPIYFCAFVAENEMKDLFGIPIDGLVVDYQGRMLISDDLPSPPMRTPASTVSGRNGDGH